MPKVSVCVPAYGNPEGVSRLLASVAEQSFTDYEVVLTDDSEDDGVRAAATGAGVKNLRYYKNEKRLGAAGNWNAAARRAKGEYIKMMHHDDWFSGPDSLGCFAAMLDGAPEAVLAFCGSFQTPLGQGQERFARCISDEQETLIRQDFRNLFLGNYIGAPSATIYRRNDREYEEKLTWVMDMEYYMRLLEKRPEFICTKEPLVCIGVSEKQLTEECRADGALNIFEYGFLFREFGLVTEKKYRDKLIGLALKFKMPYSALEPYQIPEREYRLAARLKKKEDFRFMLGVAKRKILGKQV